MSTAYSAASVIIPAQGGGGKAGTLYGWRPDVNELQDIDVQRDTTASRVNEDGQIEFVGVNVPRFDWGEGGSCPSLLVEPERTNLLLRSEEFDDAYWAKADISVNANVVLAPEGTSSADKIVEVDNFSAHSIIGPAKVPAGTHTISLFAKKAERTRIAIGSASGATDTAVFDLDAGTVVRAGESITSNGQIKAYVNGWYRLSVTLTSGSSLSSGFYIVDSGTNKSYLGDGTSGLFIWGAQLEEGSYPTSYIKTEGSQVTRNADVISKTGISSLIGQSEGTFFVEVTDWQLALDTLIFSVSDGSLNNYIQISTNSVTGNLQSVIFTGGGATPLGNTAPTVGQTVKIAVGYKLNDYALYVNGLQIGTLTSKAAPSSLTRTDVGSLAWFTAGLQPRTKLSAAALYKTRLTNDELAALTTP